MTYKVIALTRIVCPEANIPSTTALATINLERGRELGLMRGANVVMPNLTPAQYRAKYEIYPSKACISEIPSECHSCLHDRIGSIGRNLGRARRPHASRTANASSRVNHQQAVEKRRGAPVNGISKTQLGPACLREAPPYGAKVEHF